MKPYYRQFTAEQIAGSKIDDDKKAIIVRAQTPGTTYLVIAAEMKVPLGTVRSRLHRARAALGREYPLEEA